MRTPRGSPAASRGGEDGHVESERALRDRATDRPGAEPGPHGVDHVEAFKTAGVDDFIHLNANCLALLTMLQKKMGVAQ